MQTLTEIVAAVVVHSSAAAFAHFGLPVEAQSAERPPVERVVTRVQRPAPVQVIDRTAPERTRTARTPARTA